MLTEKLCGRCKEWLPVTAFNKKTSRSDGLQSWCRQCMKTANNAAYADESGQRKSAIMRRNALARERNFRFVVDYLATHHCVDCGENDLVVLDFDHVRGTKKYNIATLALSSLSIGVIEKEIAKCDVRCANCHRKVTAQRAGWRKIIGQQLPSQGMLELLTD